MRNYLLDEQGIPYPVPFGEWAKKWQEQHRVARDQISGHDVSTVFLGLDHRFGSEGPPLVFETMIFGRLTEKDEYQTSCSTLEEAHAMHKEACDWVRKRSKRNWSLWVLCAIAVITWLLLR